MKIRRPEYSRLIEKLIKKEETELFEKNQRLANANAIGVLSADRLKEILDCKENILELIKKNNNIYTIKLEKNDIYNVIFEVSPFEDTLSYDFSKEGEVWKLFTDFHKLENDYKSNGLNAFSSIMSYYGYKVINFSLEDNCLSLDFEILHELPKIEQNSSIEPKFSAEDFAADDYVNPWEDFYRDISFLKDYFSRIINKNTTNSN